MSTALRQVRCFIRRWRQEVRRRLTHNAARIAIKPEDIGSRDLTVTMKYGKITLSVKTLYPATADADFSGGSFTIRFEKPVQAKLIEIVFNPA